MKPIILSDHCFEKPDWARPGSTVHYLQTTYDKDRATRFCRCAVATTLEVEK